MLTHSFFSPLLDDMIGQALAMQVRQHRFRDLLEYDFQIPVKDMRKDLIRELWAAKAALSSSTASSSPSTTAVRSHSSTPPAKRAKRWWEPTIQQTDIMTSTVEFSIDCKIAFRNMPKTLIEAEQLIAKMKNEGHEAGDSAEQQSLLKVAHRTTIGRHCLLVDEAVDRRMASKIEKAKADGTWAGCTFASDESPPAGRRFVSLRFQVTIVYIPFFPPVKEWEKPCYLTQHPIEVDTWMCDLAHCPTKEGPGVLLTLEHQWSRISIYRTDINAGCGDGGGENEAGTHGVHALLSASNASYVRHRCCAHLGWRTADQGIIESGHTHDQLLALNRYLAGGITWMRLQNIMVQPPDQGGLGRLQQYSAEYHRVFSMAPPRILDGRPETEANFALWLLQREGQLREAIDLDINQRGLGKDGTDAKAAVFDRPGTIRRGLLGVLLKKALFVHHWIQKHPQVSATSNLPDVIKRAMNILADSAVDQYVLSYMGITQEIVDALHMEEPTWIEVLVKVHVPDDSYVDCLKVALDCFHNWSMRMVSHLQLTADNFMASCWTMAKMLSFDPLSAQRAAREFRCQLQKHRKLLTPFETCVVDNPVLMDEIDAFADQPQPLLLWHGQGRFRHVYMFLGTRFLTCPSHVLSCEGTHASWKWLETTKRGLKMKQMNAMLKLGYCVHANGSLPPAAELNPFVVGIRADMRHRIADAAANGVACGYRSDVVYHQRLNISAHQMDLLRPAEKKRSNGRGDTTSAWASYIRSVFIPLEFYSMQVTPESEFLYFMVWENKVLGGRTPPAAGQATGRPMSIAFYKRMDDHDRDIPEGELMVEALSSDTVSTIDVSLANLMELATKAGWRARRMSSKTNEQFIEKLAQKSFFDNIVLRWDYEPAGPHIYQIRKPEDAEAMS